MSMLKKMWPKKSVITAEELERERAELKEADSILFARKNQLDEKEAEINNLTKEHTNIIMQLEEQHPKLQEAQQEVGYVKQQIKQLQEQLQIAEENVIHLNETYGTLSLQRDSVKETKELKMTEYGQEKSVLLRDLGLHDEKMKKLNAKAAEFELQQKEKELKQKEKDLNNPQKRQAVLSIRPTQRVMESEKMEEYQPTQPKVLDQEVPVASPTPRVGTANIVSFDRRPVQKETVESTYVQPTVQEEIPEPTYKHSMTQSVEVLSNAPILKDEIVGKVRENMNEIAQNLSFYQDRLEGFSIIEETDTIMFEVKVRLREGGQMISEWYNFELQRPFDQLKVQLIDEGTLMDIGYEGDENCLELEDSNDLPNVTKALHNALNTLRFFMNKKKTLA